MSKVFVVFGEMGIGKNFVGELLAQRFKVPFIDGDTMLPPELEAKVKKFMPLTPAEVDSFVKDHLVPGMIDLLKVQNDPGMVLAQALYMREHREYIAKAIKRMGLTPVFVYIPVHSLLVHLSRLWSRPRGLYWALYGLVNKPFFQKPSLLEALYVYNDTNREALIERIAQLEV